MIYLLPLMLIFPLIFVYDVSTNKVGERFWYNFVVFILICIAGLRYKVGGDTLEYFNSFTNQVPTLGNLSAATFLQIRYEPFWILLNSICKTISNDFVLLQFVHAIFVNVVISRFFRKYTQFRFSSLLVYYLFYYLYYNTEILRESIAISLFVLAYPYLSKGVWAKYYILAICATLFHGSAIIMFFLPLFKTVELNKGTFVRIAFVVISAIILLKFAPNIIPDPELRRRFSGYQEFTPSLFGFLYYLGIFFLGPLYIYLQYGKYRSTLFPELITVYFTIAAVVSYLTGFNRFINYFMPFLTVYFVNYLFLIAEIKKYRQVRSLVIIAVFIISFLPKYLYYFKDTSNLVADTHNYNRWFPYTTVFNKEENEKRRMLFYRSFNYSREYKEKN